MGSINWHIPILLKTIGKERIRKISDVNNELPKLFLEILQNRDKEKDRKHISRIENIKTLIYDGYAYDSKNNKKSSKRYLIVQLYSLAIPSAINLELVSQEQPHEMLTFLGRLLLKEIEKNKINLISDSEVTLDLFRKIILHCDEKWKIIYVIENIHTNATSEKIFEELTKLEITTKVSLEKLIKKTRVEIIENLRKEGRIRNSRDVLRLSNYINTKIKFEINKKIKPDQTKILESILSLYLNAGIIKKISNKYVINKELCDRINKLKFWNIEVTDEEFIHSLKTILEKYQNQQKKIVAIPIIRDQICEELKITWVTFNEKLAKIGLESSKYGISFSRAISAKKWGISIGKINYYYISLRK